MADQSGRDVVNQTLSGGEPSPSDVPESKSAKTSAAGDEGGVDDDNVKIQPQSMDTHEMDDKKYLSFSSGNTTESDKLPDSMNSVTNRTASGLVANRVLEINGVSSLSDGFEDTGSLGGSESDTSRPDSRYHNRTGSVKKPASFKPVSFAKFSVPKAPGSSVAQKPGEKGTLSSTSSAASPQPTSRPRLVAKTASGLRDTTSKPSSAGLKATGSGPDPSQVWNKNRPTQPPPSKHLTDEELKQQYGIHMTSRIQEDGNGTEAKWADIDDDEDDWAPETIEWNDGTKIKLTHTDTAPPSQDVKSTREAAPPSSRESSSTRDSAKVLFAKPATTVGPNATVLRLGANAERQQQAAKSSNLPAKSANDKPILTAKSPAPVPVKSPWAALPPVEKVSPVNPPVQTQGPPRLPSRDSQGFDDPNVFNATVPPREIAADDFNRSWRDGQPNVPRELFNSQSGRYEPVFDNARKSSRNDGQFRPPSLLQRPTHHEQTGPAEPSAAFQTHRTSNQEGGHWNRRRASSNVSGGSGSIGRRMSFGRPDGPPKFHEGRRGSQVNGILDHAISPTDSSFQKAQNLGGTSPVQPPNGPVWQPRNTSGMTYAPPGAQSVHAQLPSPTGGTVGAENGDVQPTGEDPVALQQRIMREKLQQARQRRKEQEEKEELEKQERIRLKLQALGPLPPEKDKPGAQGQSPTEKPEATDPLNHLASAQSLPKPPIPEPSGEPKQYGMMKVHPPESVKKVVASVERPSEHPPNGLANRNSLTQNRDSKADAGSLPGNLHNNDAIQPPNQEQTGEVSKDEASVQWRGNLSSTSFTPWGSGSKLGGHGTSNANPWKPLSNDKTLGNGTFDRSLANFSSSDLPLRGHLGLPDLPAIGPPTVSNSDKAVGSQTFTGPSKLTQESQQSVQQLSGSDSRHVPFDSLNPISRPGHIAPSNMHANHWQSETRRGTEMATSAWQTFSNTARQNEAAEEKRQRELNSLRDDGTSNAPFNFNETWRQVRAGDQGGQRQVVGVNRLTENVSSLSHLHNFDATIDALPFTEHQPRHLGNITGRGSRFFPPVVDVSKRVLPADDARARSPSPPPPEDLSSHPAFSRDSHRPLVHLPTPKPVVKLPPKTLPPAPKPAQFVSMAAANPPRVVQSQHTTVTSWQDRINDLFGKKPTSERKNLLAITSATKEPLEVQTHLSLAAVSFPQITDAESQQDAGKVTSKEVEDEEMMFEDREAGSLPVVRVPNMAPPAAWHAALPPPARLRPKPLKPMQVHSIELYLLELLERDSSGNLQVVINFPGQEDSKRVPISKKQGQGSRPKGASTFRPRKNMKPRDAPTNSNASQSSSRPTSSSHTKSSTSSRGNFGQSTWGTRVPGVAH